MKDFQSVVAKPLSDIAKFRDSGAFRLAVATVISCYFALGLYAQGPQSRSLVADHPPVDAVLGPVDWIFVIDTSASMSGHGPPGNNIFPRVQSTLREFVPAIRNGDSLTIFAFDRDSRRVSGGIPRIIQGDTAGGWAVAIFDQLVAQGDRTHIGAALKDALTEYYSRTDKSRPAAIILFTDGVEDVRGIQNPTRIPAAVKLIRDEDLPYVFYVSLGTETEKQLKDLVDRLERQGHGKLFSDPGAKDLGSVVESIVRRMTPVRRPPLPLEVSPTTLNLGKRRPGEKFTGRILLKAAANTSVGLSAKGEPSDLTVRGLPPAMEVSSAKVSSVDLAFEVGEKMPEGHSSYEIEIYPIDPPREVSPQLQVVKIDLEVELSPVQKTLAMLRKNALLLGLIALLIAAFIIYLFRNRIREVFSPLLYRPEPPINAFLTSTGNGNRVALNQPITELLGLCRIHQQGKTHTVEALVPVELEEDTEVFRLNEGERRPLISNAEIKAVGSYESFVYKNPYFRK